MIVYGVSFLKKTDFRTWRAQCPNCKRETELSSFTANHFFHIYWIPIIPLGKKKLLWSCPQCEHYRDMSYSKWLNLKVEEVKHAKSRFENSDRGLEASLELRETIAFYGTLEELNWVDALIKTKFADSKELIDQYNKAEIPEKSTERSSTLKTKLSADSENHKLRYQLGWAYYKEKDYQNAYQTLMSTNPVRSNADFSPMINLAKKLPGEQRYEILKLLNEADRGWAYSHDLFQGLVVNTEKELDIPKENSIEAPQYRKRKKGRLVMAAVVAAAFLVLGIGYYFDRVNNQQLVVLNGFQDEINVSIKGVTDGSIIPGLELLKLDIPEGEYIAQINHLGIEESISFSISNEAEDIFLSKPVFVLNPSGAAVFAREEVVYTTKRLLSTDKEPVLETYTGQDFLRFEEIDYSFEYPPDEIEMDAGALSVSKWWLSMYGFEPELNTMILMDINFLEDQDRVLDYMETQLRHGYQAEGFVNMYDSISVTHNHGDRSRKFLEEIGVEINKE